MCYQCIMIALNKFYGNYTLKWVKKGIQRGEKREKRDSEVEAMKWTEKYQLSENRVIESSGDLCMPIRIFKSAYSEKECSFS